MPSWQWHANLRETDRGRAALASAPDVKQGAPRGPNVYWTDAEDAAILEHVAQYGTQDWARCAEAVDTGRTSGAAREHWRRLRKTDRGRASQRLTSSQLHAGGTSILGDSHASVTEEESESESECLDPQMRCESHARRVDEEEEEELTVEEIERAVAAAEEEVAAAELRRRQ